MQISEVIEISKALITPSIAMLGAWIAFSQYNSNELKRRHELFDRRWEIYNATLAFIDAAKVVGDRPLNEFTSSTKKFLDATAAAQYIFGKDVKDYLHNLINLNGDIAVGAMRLKSHTLRSNEDRDTLEAEITLKRMSLYKEELERCNVVFAKYMHLESQGKVTAPAVLMKFLWPIRFVLSVFNKQNWNDAFRKYQ